MSQNGITYKQNVKSSWFDDEDDVDDETFLRNSRKPPPSTVSFSTSQCEPMNHFVLYYVMLNTLFRLLLRVYHG